MTALGSVLKVEAKDALIFTGSSLLYQLGSLILLPIYWSRLSPADFGILAVIAVIGAFQTLLSSLSLDLAITRFYYEWPEETPSAEPRGDLDLELDRDARGSACCSSWPSSSSARSSSATSRTTPGCILGHRRQPAREPVHRPGQRDQDQAPAVAVQRLQPGRVPGHVHCSACGSCSASTWVCSVCSTSMIWANLIMAVAGGIVMLRFSRAGAHEPGSWRGHCGSRCRRPRRT